MGMLSRSWSQGMEKSEQLDESLKQYVFGLIAVGIYSWGGLNMLGVFYVLLIVSDYILMKRAGEI